MKNLCVFALVSGLSVLNPAHASGVSETSPAAIRHTESHTRKPTLPVSIATTLPAHIAAGESLALDVNVNSGFEQGELVIGFQPDEGVTLVSPQQQQQFTLSGGEFKTTIPLVVVPQQDGHYAVNVEIRHLGSDGRVRSVTRGITFHVGDRPSVATKARATSSVVDEDNVISMPAQETIVRP